VFTRGTGTHPKPDESTRISYYTLPELQYHVTLIVRWGAEKSLARPGRKQATANKLGIY